MPMACHSPKRKATPIRRIKMSGAQQLLTLARRIWARKVNFPQLPSDEGGGLILWRTSVWRGRLKRAVKLSDGGGQTEQRRTERQL